MRYYDLPPALSAEIDGFENDVNAFRAGAIDAMTFRARRVPFGVYEQRDEGRYMARVRTPGGLVSAEQLRRIGGAAGKYGSGRLHVTTRGEIQIHDIPIQNLVSVHRELFAAGLSCRGGGGNTVRNITAPATAGIDPREEFDVLPYCLSLTERLVAEKDSFTLPRKYKITFAAGPGDDDSLARFADLGLIAEREDGKKGFTVYVAGGLGAKSAAGIKWFDHLPAEEVYNAASAVKRVFDRNGNRKNRHAARLRFLLEKTGPEKFLELLDDSLKAVRAENHPSLFLRGTEDFEPPEPPVSAGGDSSVEFLSWKSGQARPQKKDGYYFVTVPLTLGDLNGVEASALAEIAERFGAYSLRFTQRQNLLIANIPEPSLPWVRNELLGISKSFTESPSAGGILACAGAQTCKLGICLSRGAAAAALKEIGRSAGHLPGIRINISGCPNSCGQHPVADLGFFGMAGRNGGNLYPAYTVLGGAVRTGPSPRLAVRIGEIPASNLPAFIRFSLEHYRDNAAGTGSYADYIDRIGAAALAEYLKMKNSRIPTIEEDPLFYKDHGSSQVFSLAKRGTGECSAGLFDFIDRDLKNLTAARESLSRPGLLTEERARAVYDLLLHSSRMLLITRGVEAPGHGQVFRSFIEHFLDKDYFNPESAHVWREVLSRAGEKGPAGCSDGDEEAARGLADAVTGLYERMDDSLQFGRTDGETARSIREQAPAPPVVRKDFRGVACPMNFVKTKMELSRLSPGDFLEILLDDGPPIENVPGSVTGEGHGIVSTEKTGNFWKVLIRKGE